MPRHANARFILQRELLNLDISGKQNEDSGSSRTYKDRALFLVRTTVKPRTYFIQQYLHFSSERRLRERIFIDLFLRILFEEKTTRPGLSGYCAVRKWT